METGVMPYPAAYCSPFCQEHHDTRSGDGAGLSASPMSEGFMRSSKIGGPED